MHKIIYLIALAAALIILAGIGGWVPSTTKARVHAPNTSVTIDTSQLTKSAENLPVEEFKDYSMVFE